MKSSQWFWLLLPFFLFLTSCKDNADDSQAQTDPQPEPEAATPPANEEKKPSETSIFAPINAEHAKNMDEQSEDLEAIYKRIDEAAKKQNLEVAKETEGKMAEIQSFYMAQYQEHVAKPKAEYEADLLQQYRGNLEQAHKAVIAGGQTVLAEQLSQEIQRIEAGKAIPRPPAPDDPANPGMKTLFDLRRWYHENQARLDSFHEQNLGQITRSYEKQLSEYKTWGESMLPPEALEVVTKAIDDFDSDSWWKAEPPADKPEPDSEEEPASEPAEETETP